MEIKYTYLNRVKEIKFSLDRAGRISGQLFLYEEKTAIDFKNIPEYFQRQIKTNFQGREYVWRRGKMIGETYYYWTGPFNPLAINTGNAVPIETAVAELFDDEKIIQQINDLDSLRQEERKLALREIKKGRLLALRAQKNKNKTEKV